MATNALCPHPVGWGHSFILLTVHVACTRQTRAREVGGHNQSCLAAKLYLTLEYQHQYRAQKQQTLSLIINIFTGTTQNVIYKLKKNIAEW